MEVYADYGKFKKVMKYAEEVNADGLSNEVLDSSKVKELEPSLSDIVVGGLHYKYDSTLEPEDYIKGLKEALARNGVDIFENVEVVRLEASRDRVRIKTIRVGFECRSIVLACGPWINDVL